MCILRKIKHIINITYQIHMINNVSIHSYIPIIIKRKIFTVYLTVKIKFIIGKLPSIILLYKKKKKLDIYLMGNEENIQNNK